MKDSPKLLQRFALALKRLERALAQPVTAELSVDGTIQRFEFTFELCWKSMQAALRHEGFDVKSPRATLQKAFAEEWIHDEALWLQMLEDRNDTSHTYDETLAQVIYHRIGGYMPELTRIHSLLQEKLSDA
ncbi:MAG: nucleotidyltransferase substrate binding protein [Alphaproteobacteria bacterium]|nr:nucleotidyltransferase substrate binding protein [Alphaproteobacteria bacterium]